MKNLILLCIFFLLAGCAMQTKAPEQKKELLRLERDQIIYIALPPDIGDSPEEYLQRVEGTGATAALILRDAFTPYASKVIMGTQYAEEYESAIENGRAATARYVIRMVLASYYKRPILWEPSNAALIAVIFIADADRDDQKTRRILVPLYSARGQHIPVEHIMKETLQQELSKTTEILFESE